VIIQGDASHIPLPDESIDCIVTDPPYFLINDSGGGFMNKDWDSINKEDSGYNIICKSKEFARFVLNYFTLMKVESSMVEVNTVVDNVNTQFIANNSLEKSPNHAQYVESNSQEVHRISNQNHNSAQMLVITKAEVLELLSELSLGHINVKEKIQDNALFVIPYSYIETRLRGIVQGNVLKSPTEIECVDLPIQASLMDEVRINAVIEAMIGSVLESKSTNEIDTAADYAESTARKRRYKHIILSDTNRHKTIHWIIWLLYVLNVIQRRNTIPNSYTINYDLIYQFHKSWASEALRVLKPGAFGFVMSAPRSDTLDVMIQALKDAGFKINFSPLYHSFASGFPKAANVSKLVDKRNGRDQDTYKPFSDYLKERRATKHLSMNQIDEMLGTNTAYSWWEGRLSGIQLPSKSYYLQLKTILDLDDRFDALIEREEAEREIIGSRGHKSGCYNEIKPNKFGTKALDIPLTKSATEKAKALDGAYCGMQVKPAVELVLCVMKPLSEKSYVDQALSNGKGVTWLDSARIPYQNEDDKETTIPFGVRRTVSDRQTYGKYSDDGYDKENGTNQKGRFPANLLVSDGVLNDHSRYFDLDKWYETISNTTFPFIITPKASKSERNMGLITSYMRKDQEQHENWTKGKSIRQVSKFPKYRSEHKPVFKKVNDGRSTTIDNPFQRGETLRVNSHPTVKPIKLMSYLIMLGSREGDTILDPFCGSGTTMIAAKMLNRQHIGIEINKEYANIASARLGNCMNPVPKQQQKVEPEPILNETKWIRKNEPNYNDIMTYLKQAIYQKFSHHKELASQLGVSEGLVRQWIDKSGDIHCFPTKEEWIKLKEILQFDDKYDKQMTEMIEADRSEWGGMRHGTKHYFE
jgi:DNA modification methylase